MSLSNWQDLQCDQPVHVDVPAQKYLAHAAGADRLEQLVLVVEEKPTEFSLKQLLGLELGQQSVPQHPLGQQAGLVQRHALGGHGPLERRNPLFVEQAAFPDDVQKFVTGGGYRHRCPFSPGP